MFKKILIANRGEIATYTAESVIKLVREELVRKTITVN